MSPIPDPGCGSLSLGSKFVWLYEDEDHVYARWNVKINVIRVLREKQNQLYRDICKRRFMTGIGEVPQSALCKLENEDSWGV